jgi:hypothetical protein
MVGNHHLGVGGPRYVDFLKGANMSYRTAALCEDHFDVRLRGSGAQVHNELGIGFVLSRRGWRLLYDPAVAVDHYPSVRHDADQRGATGKQSMEDRCYNAAISLTEHLVARPHCVLNLQHQRWFSCAAWIAAVPTVDGDREKYRGDSSYRRGAGT